MTTKQVIDQATSRAEVSEMLKAMKVAELKEVAKAYSVHVTGKSKAQMIERIVDSTVGSRLMREAIRGIEIRR